MRRVSVERRSCRENTRGLAPRGVCATPITVWAAGLLIAAALLLSAAAPQPARAVPSTRTGHGPIEVTADSMRYERDHGVYVAVGNVRVVRNRRTINADWVVFSRATRRGVASGHVRYVDGDEILESAFLEFDLDTLQGLVYQASLDTGPGGFVMTADRLIKTDDDHYTVRSGIFSSCRCAEDERVPWGIRARRANVEVGGYVMARNATIEILGVPVVWLPWMLFPIKNERDSGILLPEIGISSRSGFEIGLPFFWAARDGLNVIFTPTYLTDRGFKPSLEFEYVLGRKSKGKAYGTYIHDQKRERKLGPGDDPSAPENETNRWAAVLEHDQFLPGDWRIKADIKVISDNSYVDDFRDLWEYRNDRYLESKIFGFNQFGKDGSLGVVGSVVYADDLQFNDSEDRDKEVNQRLPHLQAELLSTRSERAGGLVSRLGLDYTYFYRKDAPEAGSRRPDSGNRFVIHPRISRPTRLFDRIEVFPEVGYRELLYKNEEGGFSEQGHVTARVDVRTRLERSYGAEGAKSIQHLLEPVFAWTMVTNTSLLDTPIYVPGSTVPQVRLRQLERSNLVLDPSDQIDSRNSFTIGAANRIYRAGKIFSEANFFLDYSLHGKGPDTAHLILDGFTRRLYAFSTEFNFVWDLRQNEIDEALFSLLVHPRPWISLAASYRYRDRLPLFSRDILDPLPNDNRLNQIGGGIRANVSRRFSVFYRATYDLVESERLRNAGGFEFRSACRCWAFGVTIQDDLRGGIRYRFSYSLLGIGDDSLRGEIFGGRTLVDDVLGLFRKAPASAPASAASVSEAPPSPISQGSPR